MLDPTGSEIESKMFSMNIEDDLEKNLTYSTRLFLHVGECLYIVNRKGDIIQKVIPKQN